MRAFVRRARESDDLILDDGSLRRHIALLDDLEQRIGAQTADEEHAAFGPPGVELVVGVAPILDHDRSRRETHLTSDFDVRDFAVGNHREARQIAIMVKHQVQLHRTLGAAEMRPVVHRQAQVNRRRVDAYQLVLETEFALADHLGCNLVEQIVEDLLEQLPRPVPIGVGK